MTPPLPRSEPLKDGSTALLRLATPADAQAMWRHERAVVAAGQGVVRVLTDLPPLDAFTNRLTRQLNHPDRHTKGALVLAEDPPTGALMAIGEVWRLGPTLVRHVASLSLEVHPEHQGRGVGRVVLKALVGWAERGGGAASPRVTRLDLSVRADNTRAIGLYTSEGFVSEGVRRGFVRTTAGELLDDLVMVRFLNLSRL